MEDPTVPHIMQLMPKTFGIRDKVKKLLEEQAIQKIHDELKSVEGVTIETKNTRMIQEAGTIEGLLFCIESIGPITGSQKTYTPGELMLAIYNYIREPSKLALMTITGTYGIRQKVQELAAINDQNIDTMRLPGSLITELANQAVSTDQRGTQYHNLEAGYARIIPQEENQAALKKEKTKKPGLFSRWFGGGN
jgi:hypothetical protein